MFTVEFHEGVEDDFDCISVMNPYLNEPGKKYATNVVEIRPLTPYCCCEESKGEYSQTGKCYATFPEAYEKCKTTCTVY